MKKILWTACLSLGILSACNCDFCDLDAKNIALGKTATASGNENNNFIPAKLVDGIINRNASSGEQSRWASNVIGDNQMKNGVWTAEKPADNMWVQIDLGHVYNTIQDIVIDWEFAKVSNYAIELSNDGTTWRTVYESKKIASTPSEIISLAKPESARFIKLVIKQFNKQIWGTVSIFEIQVFDGKMPENASMIAQKLTAESFDISGESVKFDLPKGAKAKIIGSTYEQIIDFDGNIHRPLSDMTTKVTFEIEKKGEKAQTATFPFTIKGTEKAIANANIKPNVIPSLQEWVGSTGAFTANANTKIIVNKKDAEKGKPTLLERMTVFAADFEDITGFKTEIILGNAPAKNAIFVSLQDDNLGKEGYAIDVKSNEVSISATEPIGAFWATRSLLQVFRNNNNSFPCGKLRDYPQYPVRGFMYDIGRKHATIETLRDVTKLMSWFKMNDLQLHLNDNFIWLHDYTKIPNSKNATPEQKKAAAAEILKAAPTAFRLESNKVGKDGTKLTASDYSISKKDFGDLIDLAKLYSVNITPEIDIPGHAMSFVKVRPELMYQGTVHKEHDVERTALLDASTAIYDPATGRTYRDETLSFIQSVFDEYLDSVDGQPPVFRDAVIHIGTDEYYGDPEDYRAFADAMLKYIKSKGFTPRFWGSLSAKRGKTPVNSDGVQMHIWSLGWNNPNQALAEGFDIINILDGHSYIVPSGTGSVGAYCDYLNLGRVYNPSWSPNTMGGQSVVPGHKKLLGAQWALWNDNSFRRDFGFVDYDLFDRILESSAVFSEKSWNDGKDLSYDEFKKLIKDVDVAPNTNPRHIVKANKDGNFFTKEKVELKPGMVVETGIDGIAPNYVAEFFVTRQSDKNDEQVLFESYTGAFKAVQKETGKVGITRDALDYSFDYTLPVGKRVKMKLVAEGRNVKLFVDDKEIGTPKRHAFPEAHRFSTFIFPIKNIGAKTNGFTGTIENLKVSELKK